MPYQLMIVFKLISDQIPEVVSNKVPELVPTLQSETVKLQQQPSSASNPTLQSGTLQQPTPIVESKCLLENHLPSQVSEDKMMLREKPSRFK